jgi:RNA polymerase sigma factor (sigma-70 family)
MEFTPSDAEVVQASLTEPERFALIFDRHADAVGHFFMRHVGPSRAEDLTMDTFMVAFARRHRFDAERGNAKPWLFGIATRLLLHEARSSRRRSAAYAKSPPDIRTSPSEIDRLHERLEAEAEIAPILGRLRTLNRRERDPLLLLAWADLSYEEIAVALGVPIGTVKSRIARARRKLREPFPSRGQLTTEELREKGIGSG